MTAARLAQVLTGDAHPLVLGGRGEHPLQQLAVVGLQLVALLERRARRGDALGERVTNLLELTEPGDARLPERGGHAGVQAEAREGLDAESGELPLETTDLAAQLSACEALIASHSKRSKRVSIEQIRHGTGLSVDHHRGAKARAPLSGAWDIVSDS